MRLQGLRIALSSNFALREVRATEGVCVGWGVTEWDWRFGRELWGARLGRLRLICRHKALLR